MPFLLEIVTPEKTFFSGSVDEVYLSGSQGEIGILEAHAPLLTVLKPGELRYLQSGKTTTLVTGTGFVEVVNDRISVITDLAATEQEIDEDKIQSAIYDAEKSLLDAQSNGNREEALRLETILAKDFALLLYKMKKRQPH